MPDDKRSQYRQAFEASAIAWIFPLAIALGAGWGWGMDRLFGTKPVLTWIFTGFGIIAAFVQLFRIAGAKDDSGSGDGNTPPPPAD